MQKINFILVLATVLFTNLLSAQERPISKEKKQIINKYKNRENNSFQPSSKELKIIYDHLIHMDSEDIEKEFWKNNKRIPDKKEIEQNQNIQKNKAQSSKISSTPIPLPGDARFPGEFEEIQGVFVNYPYYNGFPYIAESSDYPSGPKFFRELINAIQQAGVTAFLSIRSEIDKNLIIQYFKDKGTPLTNYQFLVNPTNSIWARDFGPVNFYYGNDDKIGWVDLKYYDGRVLDDALTPIWAEKFGIPYTYMPIDFEGGNILMNGQQTLTTSKRIFTNNPDYTDLQIRNTLKESFNLENLYILDDLTYDGGTGHVDIYLDMLNENTFVYTKRPIQMATIPNYPDYQTIQNNINFLQSQTSPGGTGKPYITESIPFPTRNDGSVYDNLEDLYKYTRTYSNHLIVNKTIIQPIFSNSVSGNTVGDEAALDILRKKYPGYQIIPIDGRAYQGSGGSIHCVTKEFHAENPIRFKHYPYHNEINSCQSSYPIDALITNKSGIKQATLFSRVKGATVWNQINMTQAPNNRWESSITSTSNNDIIEYYIAATSNNGKTMTYPMTGAEGGAFTFWCTSSCAKELIVSSIYNESFENSLGDWTQDTNDDIDWKLSTTGQTSPTTSYDGAYYLFSENSGGTANKNAILKSPCLDLSGASAALFNFRYYIYGNTNVGDVSLEASDDNGFTWKKLWQTTNTGTNTWISATIDLKDYVGETVQLRFNHTTGSNPQASISIDALSLDTESGNTDTQAPSIPEGLQVTNVTESSITLSWNPSTDNVAVTGYTVYQNNTIAANVTTNTIIIEGLNSNTTYQFKVQAKDDAGNTSGDSSTISATTNPIAASPCNGGITLIETSGIIENNSNTGNYQNNLNCIWVIKPSVTGNITLTFDTFDTEFNYDFVTVYDGDNTSANQIGTYSGNTIPTGITSSGNSLTIQFTSDGSVTRTGWKAQYTVNSSSCSDGIQNGNETGIDCGGSCQPCSSGCLDNPVTISITFDNYPQETSWTITNSSGQVVAQEQYDNTNSNGSTTQKELCLPRGCYDFEIKDSYGDGICCTEGNGSYQITDNSGTILASGGNFSSNEQKSICFNGLKGEAIFTNVQLQLFPNPVKSILHIQNTKELRSYQILGLPGNIISTGMFDLTSGKTFNTINISDLAKGGYMLKVVYNDDTFTTKMFVKE